MFGLLALAVFINWFGLCQASALVGGLTLALMTMPVIVIAARNAIKAVPPSIRDAALGVGASPVQVVFHHVLPLALPGIRSEEHTSELQSLMRISYAVLCFKNTKTRKYHQS